MLVSLIKDSQIFSMTLPFKVKGQYWITDLDSNGKARNLISIEAVNESWLVKSNKNVNVLDPDGNAVADAVLKTGSFYCLEINDSDEHALLYAELIDESRQKIKKYVVKDACVLTIGRNQENTICFNNKYVSGNHARLTYDGSVWSISDIGSTNGTFVNDYRIETQPLRYGDYIYIMGLKIVVGKQFFAINNPDNQVRISSSQIIEFENQNIIESENREADMEEPFFYRSPRFKRQIESSVITIDSPPAPEKGDNTPMTLVIGPSITMGMASLSTGIMSVISMMNNDGDMLQAAPTLIMAGSMLIGMVLWPILTKRHENRQREKNEKKRQKKYLEYLDMIRDEIKRTSKEQSDILNENLITNDECAKRIEKVKRNLWERVIGQEDFLRLRVGIGNLPLDAVIEYPKRTFSMTDDNLLNALYSLGNEPKVLMNVPVSISLTDNYVAGLIGIRSEVVRLAKQMLLQMIALHSYDELKLIVIVDKEELWDWKFVKWLPHIWNDEKTMRYLASSVDEVKELSVFLERNILPRAGNKDLIYSDFIPYYVIISLSRELADKCEAIRQILKLKTNVGCSIITLYDEIKNLPKETSAVVEVNGGESKIFDKDDLTGKNIKFAIETSDKIDINKVAFDIANIHLDLNSQRFALPGMITFLELFKVGKIEHLNSLTRWKENNPTITLQTPVGVDTMGETFYLDLHEKFHGPHGLVAGMTGSGKSEFIITYILSLAVNYHPDEVAFILIDYKGGGLTGAFENPDKGIKLPHLAGTITNLDGAAVKRSLISIQSELRRRQAIFNEARVISNEGTMDIYKYQQLYRQKIVSEPVPHLFIISDEFAELKSQQPDFMEQLISAARIGRSLGVHLILATQKPSGVVDDQIWSNSKFRVCLKVQEKADSEDMIKCPDAAELSDTGRFYLQVGFNELFALGQSAWCGADYVPNDVAERTVERGIKLVDNLGRVMKEAKCDCNIQGNNPAETTARKVKQVVGIVQYLSDLAREENISVRPLWTEPIPEMIYVDEVEKKYGYRAERTILNPVVGEYDEPFNQRQNILTLPISEEGNCILYGSAGNGKATFITTLIYSLLRHHDAEELNIYVLDFGAETLRAFDKAPQVGNVLLAYESEKVLNLFKMLGKELENRKRLFAEFGGDYVSYCKNSGNVVPNILVIINNYAGFSEQYEDLEEDVAFLSRDGLKYGINFVLTASTTNTVRYRIQQNFKQMLTMQLNDPTDYPIIVGKTDGLRPSKYKGRGLVNLGNAYEFQTAHCVRCDDTFDYIRRYCEELCRSAEHYAKPVPVLPKAVTYDEISTYITDGTKVPIGINKNTLVPANVNIAAHYIYSVVSREPDSLGGFIVCFARVLQKIYGDVSILDSEKMFMGEELSGYEYVDSKFEDFIVELFGIVVERNNVYKDAGRNIAVLEKYPQKVIIICGYSNIYEQLSEDGKDKLNLLLEKGEEIYKIHIILLETVSRLEVHSGENWYRRYITGSDGLYIGDGVAEQYVLKITKMTSNLYEEIGEEFGYAVNRGRAALVKVLSAGIPEMEE